MLKMYFLSSPASGALICLYENEDEKWGINVIKEQCYSDTDGHKDVCCNVNDCVYTRANTSSGTLKHPIYLCDKIMSRPSRLY